MDACQLADLLRRRVLYPENIFEKLGLRDVKMHTAQYCLSDAGRQRIFQAPPIQAFEDLKKALEQSNEFKRLLLEDTAFPDKDYLPIAGHAELLKIEGAFLTEEALTALRASVSTCLLILDYFEKSAEEGKYPALSAMMVPYQREPRIVALIDKVIDQTGQVRANASPAFEKIIRLMAEQEREARKRIQSLLREAQQEGWVAEGGNLTVRDGRLCLPILAEHKRRIKGFVHDASATGQTLYVEPSEVFELNNTLRDLEIEKQREKVKILKSLSATLSPYASSLQCYDELLIAIDFIRAKTLFAISVAATLPVLKNEPTLSYLGANHPLLYLNFKKTSTTLVPLDIGITAEHRIVLVSGPNAGGKSVCLKTVGLLQLMLQSGWLIPVDEVSEAGFFDNIMADIGDDQSIESDLSTYSAHLNNMKILLEHAGPHSLVLIDEFGTGTDPQFGGPIAESVLERLNERGTRGIITTHFSNLKLYASATEGIVNASMRFDNVKMQPLFKLEMGQPGSSYAFEIAQKIGLPETVIASARQKAGIEAEKVDQMLINLEREKKEMYDLKAALKEEKRKMDVVAGENRSLNEYLKENRKSILREAKKEAEAIILQANKAIENTIREIKTGHADKAITQQARKKLKEDLDALQQAEEVAKPVAEIVKEVFKVGDFANVIGQETIGEIISLQRDQAVLAIGELKTAVKLDRLQRASTLQSKKVGTSSLSSKMHAEASAFMPDLDVRGMRSDEAIDKVEKLLDKAIMLGFPSIKVVHGKGDGILRKQIRQHLKGYKQIEKLESEHPDRGGDGITYVYLG